MLSKVCSSGVYCFHILLLNFVKLISRVTSTFKGSINISRVFLLKVLYAELAKKQNPPVQLKLNILWKKSNEEVFLYLLPVYPLVTSYLWLSDLRTITRKSLCSFRLRKRMEQKILYAVMTNRAPN